MIRNQKAALKWAAALSIALFSLFSSPFSEAQIKVCHFYPQRPHECGLCFSLLQWWLRQHDFAAQIKVAPTSQQIRVILKDFDLSDVKRAQRLLPLSGYWKGFLVFLVDGHYVEQRGDPFIKIGGMEQWVPLRESLNATTIGNLGKIKERYAHSDDKELRVMGSFLRRKEGPYPYELSLDVFTKPHDIGL